MDENNILKAAHPFAAWSVMMAQAGDMPDQGIGCPQNLDPAATIDAKIAAIPGNRWEYPVTVGSYDLWVSLVLK